VLLVLDLHSGVPVYRQLMEQVKFHVASGLLKPGDELPSTRALSADLKINPMTVSKAYGLLEREGVVERHRGLALKVAPLARGASARRKAEQLRQVLTPAAVSVQQLGVSTEDAIEMLRDLLETTHARTAGVR
jgi:GntR family transcriptional regulator